MVVRSFFETYFTVWQLHLGQGDVVELRRSLTKSAKRCQALLAFTQREA